MLTQQERDEFEKLVEPIMEWLAKKFHPHTEIRITSTEAELTVGILSHSTDKFLVD